MPTRIHTSLRLGQAYAIAGTGRRDLGEEAVRRVVDEAPQSSQARLCGANVEGIRITPNLIRSTQDGAVRLAQT
jgi:hypothetical protein